MTKSMVKPRNILLTLKKHNVNSYITMKQVYNARYAYRSFIRDNNTEMQQLMKLLERDQYIHWHRLKDENVVRDIFWSHPDAVKLSNACNLVFLIDSTYKTNRYRLSLLDIDGLTPTWMTFSTAFAYLECCLGSRPVSRYFSEMWCTPWSYYYRQRFSIDECSENYFPWVYQFVFSVSHWYECKGKM